MWTAIITRPNATTSFSRSWRTTFCGSSRSRAAPRVARASCRARSAFRTWAAASHAIRCARRRRPRTASCAMCNWAIEERGLALTFHSGVNMGEPVFKSLNRFASVHALGFPFYNILHMTNWVTNGLGERFPKLPVIWTEGGLAWIPFLMQRLDHEFMLRSSEYPLLKKKPSDYMRAMYYASQPMEADNLRALACTFEMINAQTQLLYASDYPHWDFDLPSRIWDLPFLSEKAKHNILGGNAARLFKLPPRSPQQKANPDRFGNLAA